MASTETSVPSLAARALRSFLGGGPKGQIPLTARDDVRADRAMLVEMLDRDPDAFSSDLDVQFVMQFWSGRF